MIEASIKFDIEHDLSEYINAATQKALYDAWDELIKRAKNIMDFEPVVGRRANIREKREDSDWKEYYAKTKELKTNHNVTFNLRKNFEVVTLWWWTWISRGDIWWVTKILKWKRSWKTYTRRNIDKLWLWYKNVKFAWEIWVSVVNEVDYADDFETSKYWNVLWRAYFNSRTDLNRIIRDSLDSNLRKWKI